MKKATTAEVLFWHLQQSGRKYISKRWHKIFRSGLERTKANSLLIMNYSSFEDSMGYLCIEYIVRLCLPRVLSLKRRSHNDLLDQLIGCEFSTSLKPTIKHRLLTQTLNTIPNRTTNPNGSFSSQHFVCKRTLWLAHDVKWNTTVSITVLG